MEDECIRDDFSAKRQYMLSKDLKGRGISDARVLQAMAEIARERFVPDNQKKQAYNDGPLPIGCDQTISQPYIVALMSQKLKVAPEMEVLEIGTGSGYQTAVLAKLAKKVYTVERLEELSLGARAVLCESGITNVEYFIGDGSCGWPTGRTFDRIMVTAALPEVPETLIGQLVDSGILVAPVGSSSVQRLISLEKSGDMIAERFICDVRFVPVVGEHGFSR